MMTCRDCVWNITKPAKSFGLIHESNDFGRNGLIDLELEKDDEQDQIFVVMSAPALSYTCEACTYM